MRSTSLRVQTSASKSTRRHQSKTMGRTFAELFNEWERGEGRPLLNWFIDPDEEERRCAAISRYI